MNEVYISGAGCISAAGDGWRESAAGLYADAGVVPFPPSERIGSTLATPVFELTEFDPGNESKSMAFLHHALKEALDSAGLAAGGLRGKNVCVSIGTTAFRDSGFLGAAPEFLYVESFGENPARIRSGGVRPDGFQCVRVRCGCDCPGIPECRFRRV